MSITTVIVLGATGNLGRPIISALLDANFHVTAVTRSQSFTLPHRKAANLTVKTVDLSSKSSLVALFTGQDAIIEAFPPAIADAHQKTVVEAAIEAGVTHIITPEFAGDTFNAHVSELLIYEPKVNAQRVLEDAITTYKDQGTTSVPKWTAIITGPWYDWAIKNELFWVDAKTRTVKVIGSGNQRYSMSSVTTISAAVVDVLSNPGNSDYINRPVYVADYTVSTKELIVILEEILAGWKVEHIFEDCVDKFYELGSQSWLQDPRGASEKYGTEAYRMLGTYAIFEEHNKYVADFENKAVGKWKKGREQLKAELAALINSV